MTCVTTGEPVLRAQPPFAGASERGDGHRPVVLQPPTVPTYGSYRTGASEHARIAAARQRADARTRGRGCSA